MWKKNFKPLILFASIMLLINANAEANGKICFECGGKQANGLCAFVGKAHNQFTNEYIRFGSTDGAKSMAILSHSYVNNTSNKIIVGVWQGTSPEKKLEVMLNNSSQASPGYESVPMGAKIVVWGSSGNLQYKVIPNGGCP